MLGFDGHYGNAVMAMMTILVTMMMLYDGLRKEKFIYDNAAAAADVCVSVCVILYMCILVTIDELCRVLGAHERWGVTQILIIIDCLL